MRALVLLGSVLATGFCVDVKLSPLLYNRNSDSLASQYTAKLSESMRRPKIPQNFVPVLNEPPAGPSHDEIKLRKPKTRTSELSDGNYDALKAALHFVEMEEKTVCSQPSPRVFCVQDHYPSVDVAYMPACTILHRCTSESGCCKDPNKTCSAKEVKKVTLYFEDSSKELATVKLDFMNHTSCHCEITNEVEDSESTDFGVQHDNGVNPSDSDEDYEEDVISTCPRCPRPFSKRFSRGICECDCFQDDVSCIRIKKGREALDSAERGCVRRRVCNQPTCAAGSYYNEDFGECRKTYYEEIVGTTDSLTDQPETTEVTKLRRVRHGRKKIERTPSQ